MKQQSWLLVIFFLLFTSNSQASINCNKPKLKKPVVQNSLYHFTATVTCELKDENINLGSLNDAYLADITKKDSQFKVHKQKNYNGPKGITGYTLDVTQSYDTPNGAVTVRANVIIADNKDKEFYYELKSRSMSGQGDANLEKSMLNTTKLEVSGNKAKILVVKEIDVEKPWYAPEDLFMEAVEASVEKSVNKTALLNAKKIAGQNVDALEK